LVEVYNGSSYADIGANVFGELDTVALAAHCGSNDGFVSKWYDQSGNSNDATQATTANMPKIYDGTTGVVTENGKPAVDFDGSNDNLTSAAYDQATATAILVQTNDTTNDVDRAWPVKGYTTNKNTFGQASDLSLRYDGAASLGTQTPATGTQYLRFAMRSTATQTEHVNGYSNVSTSLTLPNIIGNINLGNANRNPSFYNGKIQEAILYNSDQSSNRANIEDNINTFYSIY
jgi:hypothetical protein